MVERFAELARQFQERVRSEYDSPSGDVVIVVHSVDKWGNLMPQVRLSQTFSVTVNFPDRAAAYARGMEMLTDGICGNIQSLLHTLDDRLKRYVWFDRPVRVVNFELEFE